MAGSYKKRKLDTQRDTKGVCTQRDSDGRRQQEGSCLQDKERGHRRNQPHWHLDLVLLASRTERMHFFCLNHPQPEHTNIYQLDFSSSGPWKKSACVWGASSPSQPAWALGCELHPSSQLAGCSWSVPPFRTQSSIYILMKRLSSSLT